MKILTTFVILLLVTTACDQELTVSKNDAPTQLIYQMTSIADINSSIDLTPLQEQVRSTAFVKQFAPQIELSKEVSFEDTSIKAIVTPLKNQALEGDISLVNYLTEDGDLYESKLISWITKEKESYICTFYTLEGVLVSRVKSTNGVVSVVKQDKMASGRTLGVVESTAKCVGSVMNQMSNGTVLGSASAIGCMIFSGYCAAGVAVSCAAMGIAETIKGAPLGSSK